MIFDWCGEDDLMFFSFEGDLSHLSQTFINSGDATDENLDELNSLVFEPDTGKQIPPKNYTFPYDFYVPGQTAIIVCGFLP